MSFKNPLPQPVKVDINQTKPVKCPRCGCESFTQIQFMREIPALISPTGKQEIIPMPAMECRKCRHVYEFGEKLSEKAQKVVGIVSALLWISRKIKNLFRK